MKIENFENFKKIENFEIFKKIRNFGVHEGKGIPPPGVGESRPGLVGLSLCFKKFSRSKPYVPRGVLAHAKINLAEC